MFCIKLIFATIACRSYKLLLFKHNSLFLLILTLLSQLTQGAFSEVIYNPPETTTVPLGEIPRSWYELEMNEMTAPLHLLVSALQSNQKSLSSYSGTHVIDYHLAMDRDFMSMLGYNSDSESESIRKSQLVVKIASDFQKRLTFRKSEYAECFYESQGEKLEIENICTFDATSIDTPTKFIYRQNDTQHRVSINISELSNHPSVLIENVARVEPPEWMDDKPLELGLNPCAFYDLGYWNSPAFICDLLEGKYGSERQARMSQAVHIFESTDDLGNKWFRLQQLFSAKRVIDVFWSESSGFMPVYNISVNKTGEIHHILHVKWKPVNGVYVPSDILEFYNRDNGEFNYYRQTSVNDIKVNEPIDQNLFAYKSLGLAEGSIIVDNIERKVYHFENGAPVFLSKFHTHYKLKEQLKFSKVRLCISFIGFGMIGAGFYLRHRCKRKDN